MKMQVAFLPGGQFALVLSKVNSAEVTQQVMDTFGEGIRRQTGAAALMAFEDDVELEGFAAHGRSEQRTSSDALRDLYDRTRTGLPLRDREQEG